MPCHAGFTSRAELSWMLPLRSSHSFSERAEPPVVWCPALHKHKRNTAPPEFQLETFARVDVQLAQGKQSLPVSGNGCCRCSFCVSLLRVCPQIGLRR